MEEKKDINKIWNEIESQEDENEKYTEKRNDIKNTKGRIVYKIKIIANLFILIVYYLIMGIFDMGLFGFDHDVGVSSYKEKIPMICYIIKYFIMFLGIVLLILSIILKIRSSNLENNDENKVTIKVNLKLSRILLDTFFLTSYLFIRGFVLYFLFYVI